MPQKLSNEQIEQQMKNIHGWTREDNAIKKDWEFADFTEAMQFINRVAELAEEHDHHPELYNVYNKVSLKFSTHDAGGLTERDFRIATDIDQLP
jgi:4a-hydroxytetrahydrobiopterin dehydratase